MQPAPSVPHGGANQTDRVAEANAVGALTVQRRLHVSFEIRQTLPRMILALRWRQCLIRG
jgi:hypothetical protein